MSAKFWAVFRCDSNQVFFCVTRDSWDAAMEFAETLVLDNPGQEYVVLEAVRSCVKAEVQWSECKDVGPMPF